MKTVLPLLLTGVLFVAFGLYALAHGAYFTATAAGAATVCETLLIRWILR